MQHRDFPLGAADGVVNQVEFDLEFLALLDLGPVGVQQRKGFGDLARNRCADRFHCHALAGAGAAHLGTDGAQFGHDLVMHGTDIAVSDRGYRHVANDCLFDTKTSAMNRHENCS